MKTPYLPIMLSAALLAWGYAPAVLSQTVQTHEQASKTVALRNVAVRDGVISAAVVNKSNHVIRDVQLLIRHAWLWKNEFQPGEEALGRAVFYDVKWELRPGDSIPFRYNPSPPLPSRTDGYFETEVSVAGFTEVIPR
jgi:hypothetical protein